jgi:hypothetical protein
MKQTAVEWLIEMLYSPVCKGFIEGRTQIPFHIIEQAKKMENKQRIMDYNAGHADGLCNHINDANNYINEQNYLKGENID